MNSKFRLLVAFILLLVSSQTSLGRDHEKMIIPVTNRATVDGMQENQPAPTTAFEVVKITFSQEVNKVHNTQPAPEDGKMHTYHFSRLDKKRWRRLYRLLARIILLVAHVCFLICSYLHLTA